MKHKAGSAPWNEIVWQDLTSLCQPLEERMPSEEWMVENWLLNNCKGKQRLQETIIKMRAFKNQKPVAILTILSWEVAADKITLFICSGNSS